MKRLGLLRRVLSCAAAAATLVGCSESATGGDGDLLDPGARPGGSVGVTQGGAQDIALFRASVARGEVPSPDRLDAVGFFAEHGVDLPAATCGASVCLHPQLAVAPRFDGGNWTAAYVGLNSPVTVGDDTRPPVHAVIAVEAALLGRELTRGTLGDGVRALAGGLGEADLVTLLLLDEGVHPVLERAAAAVAAGLTTRDVEDVEAETGDALDLHGGLTAAAAAATMDGTFEGAGRVVLVTAGRPTAGLSAERVLALGEGLARGGLGLSLVGVATPVDPAGAEAGARLVGALGDVGAGTVAFAESQTDFVQILAREGRTRLTPLGLDFRLELRPAQAYRATRVTGARRAAIDGEGIAVLESPVLMLGGRAGASDVAGGRRGGGGGLFVALQADAGLGWDPGLAAFEMRATWRDAATGAPVEVRQTVINGLAPGQNPDDWFPWFSAPEHGKPFMMVNMYQALRAMLELYDAGDCARARGVVPMMRRSVEAWLAEVDDPDTEADMDLLEALDANVATRCAITPIEPIVETRELGCFGA